MILKEFKEQLEDMPDDLEVLVGCLDINGKALQAPAWIVTSVAKTKKTCVVEINYIRH